jgi:hypothetical protein
LGLEQISQPRSAREAGEARLTPDHGRDAMAQGMAGYENPPLDSGGQEATRLRPIRGSTEGKSDRNGADRGCLEVAAVPTLNPFLDRAISDLQIPCEELRGASCAPSLFPDQTLDLADGELLRGR